MSSQLEIEFKNMVTKEEFERVIQEFQIQPSDFIKQENYYFDSANYDLKKVNCALRIRKKKDKYELTLKQPVEDGILETTDILSEYEAIEMINSGILSCGTVKEKLYQLNIQVNTLLNYGCLTTRRAEVVFLGGILVFDNSSYLNREDYEIEYEVKEKTSGEQIFLALLERFDIPLRPTENKIMRFYQAYKDDNGK